MLNLVKDHILDSFNELLKEYPFEKISVKMIIEKSGVSKSSFYRNYMDKYDVMYYKYKRQVGEWQKAHKCHSWKEMFTTIFQASERDKNREKNAFSYIGTNSYSEALYDYSYEMVEMMTERCRGTPFTQEEKIKVSLFVYGTVSLNLDYVNGKINISPEKIGQYVYEAMPETVRDLWTDDIGEIDKSTNKDKSNCSEL